MSVDLVRLASLDLVRGFVAVGRRMGVTLAAQDLCLTQSAVSRQVRALEDLLGVRLLVRGHRSIAFTPEGERLFAVADVAVRQLQDVIGAIRAGAGPRPVTITTSIGVAGLWLLPRLGDFLQRHPGIDVRIAASSRPADLRQDGPDLAIRYCAPDAAPQGATKLFGETVAPVAHPSLALPALDGRQDIEALTLLEFDGDARPWLQWEHCLAAQGWGGVRARGVLRFNQYDQMIQAAIAGQGVALGRLELLGGALADGRLTVIRTPAPLPAAPNAYWLVRPAGPARSEVDEVARWIESEAARVGA
jgi:LysR family transcriptional regulator, glycine cleavage system transcriptional activator